MIYTFVNFDPIEATTIIQAFLVLHLTDWWFYQKDILWWAW